MREVTERRWPVKPALSTPPVKIQPPLDFVFRFASAVDGHLAHSSGVRFSVFRAAQWDI
jgi:hypothetical protein